MNRTLRARRAGFTLIELLVVIAIIAILVALLLPAVQQVREAARTTQCQDHLHNIALALHNYESSYRRLPIANYLNTVNPERRSASWLVRVLPFMEQKAAYDQLDHVTSAWDPRGPSGAMTHWKTINELDVEAFNCPSSPLPTVRTDAANGATTALGAPATLNFQLTNYVGINGSYFDPTTKAAVVSSLWTSYCRSVWNGAIEPASNTGYSGKGAPMAAFQDGTSNVFAVGEQSDWLRYDTNNDGIIDKVDRRACNWYGGTWSGGAGGDAGWWLNVTSIRYPINGIGAGSGYQASYWKHTPITSAHPGGAQFALMDGKVRMVSENVDFWLLQGLAAKDDGAIVGTY